MKIGFIGLGHMGAHMAHNLAKAGHDVTVFDMRKEAVDAMVARTPGMRAGGSIADVARDADLVGASLPGPAEIEAVVLGPGGLLESMKPGAIYVDHSTNSVTMVRKVAAALKAKGIDMLDAPVSGGERGSEAGSLSVMVGGDESIWDKAQPELQAIGGKVFYCGPTGAGAVVKLCNNAAAFGHQAVVAETLTMGVMAGVESENPGIRHWRQQRPIDHADQRLPKSHLQAQLRRLRLHHCPQREGPAPGHAARHRHGSGSEAHRRRTRSPEGSV